MTLWPSTIFFNPEDGKLAVKSQVVNVSGFAGHMVSIAMTGLCHGNPKAATGHTYTSK